MPPRCSDCGGHMAAHKYLREKLRDGAPVAHTREWTTVYLCTKCDLTPDPRPLEEEIDG